MSLEYSVELRKDIPSTHQFPKNLTGSCQNQKPKRPQIFKESLAPIQLKHKPYLLSPPISKQIMEPLDNIFIREAAYEFTMKIFRTKPMLTSEERSKRIYDYYSKFAKRKFLAKQGLLEEASLMNLPNNIAELNIPRDLLKSQRDDLINNIDQNSLSQSVIKHPFQFRMSPHNSEKEPTEQEQMDFEEGFLRMPIHNKTSPLASKSKKTYSKEPNSQKIPNFMIESKNKNSTPLSKNTPRLSLLKNNTPQNDQFSNSLCDLSTEEKSLEFITPKPSKLPSIKVGKNCIYKENNDFDRSKLIPIETPGKLDSQPNVKQEFSSNQKKFKESVAHKFNKLHHSDIISPQKKNIVIETLEINMFQNTPGGSIDSNANQEKLNQNLEISSSCQQIPYKPKISQRDFAFQKQSATPQHTITPQKPLSSSQNSKIKVILRPQNSRFKDEIFINSHCKFVPTANDKTSFMTPNNSAKTEESKPKGLSDQISSEKEDHISDSKIIERRAQQLLYYDLVIKIDSLSKFKDGIEIATNDLGKLNKYTNSKYIAVLGLPGTGKTYVANYIATKKVYPYYYNPSNLIKFKVVPNQFDKKSANIVIDSPGFNYPIKDKGLIRKIFSNDSFQEMHLDSLATSAFSLDYIKSLSDVLIITTNKTTLMDQLILSVLSKKFDCELIMVHNFPDVNTPEQLEKKIITEIIDPFDVKKELIEPYGMPVFIQQVESLNRKIIHLVMVNDKCPIAYLNEHIYNYINSEIGFSKRRCTNSVKPINALVEMINLKLKEYLVESESEINSIFDPEQHKIVFNMNKNQEFRVNPKFMNVLKKTMIFGD